MPRTRRHPVGARLICGIAVIVFGLLMILDNFEVLEADDLFIYWPVALIAIGLTKIFSRNPPDLVFAAGFIGFGSWILLFNVGLIDVEPWEFFWPIVLVFGGTVLVIGAMRRSVPAAANADAGSTVRGFALLSGVERTNSSPNFLGGELTAVMGGCEVDLRQAKISDGNPVLEVFVMWGGIGIRVPREWRVDSRVMPFLGGFEDATEHGGDDDRPVLTIKGAAIMGGIEVKN